MAITEKFIGSWNLISMTSEGEDGEKLYPIGKHVAGLLSYNKDKIMSAQLGSLSRKKFKNPDYRKGEDIEINESFNNYISYFGKFRTNEEKSFVVHEVEQSLFPNWIGTKVKRYYTFEENKLILKATPILYGERLMTPTLVWEKI